MFDPWIVLSNLSDPITLLLMTLSACFGIIMGAIPGLSGTLGIALLLPFTFGLEPATALLMLGSVYCGSEYGGSIPAILINTPGTAAALCTTFDGHTLAMKGQAQKALFTALISSVCGGIFGVSALLFLSVPLANVSMKFGAPEQFWLCVFALTIIASLSSGNVLKGVIGALIGLVLACVGALQSRSRRVLADAEGFLPPDLGGGRIRGHRRHRGHHAGRGRQHRFLCGLQ